MATQVLERPPQETAGLEVEAPPLQPAPAPRGRLLLLWPLAGAVLLWCSFFPIALGWLAWVALVPLLAVGRWPARPRTVYLAAWAGGLAFYGTALQWMSVADPRMVLTW